ncbi:di-trans,poly-cis-decaprenylcistransferase [candidate division WWE3 bacterium]|uniref:Isoprenyl transferase n=1 Tax=candidate division WWE3 bacterium TaxID=2053526 RepID=A0A955LLA3_UNCKA|nr:di-trans,poly-cis-decaprenylcistransferase [candidate division WWE3 bacterium]
MQDDKSSMTPQHVGIIMDGNRRWANERGLSHLEGHKVALNRLQDIIQTSVENDVPYLTAWAWSTKNWKRNKEFIEGIIWLFREQLKPGGVFDQAIEKGAMLRQIGSLEGFPKDVQDRAFEYFNRKPNEVKIVVNVALGYEGRDELMRAYKKMVDDGVTSDEIDADMVSGYLDTAGQPDVDLVIRTGGDHRTSGFMIWQAADAEYYFTQTLMPDFGASEYQEALRDYAGRERRLGGDSKKY